MLFRVTYVVVTDLRLLVHAVKRRTILRTFSSLSPAASQADFTVQYNDFCL